MYILRHYGSLMVCIIDVCLYDDYLITGIA